MINGCNLVDVTGNTLIAIRRIIDKTSKSHFPLEDLMQAQIKRTLKIEEDRLKKF